MAHYGVLGTNRLEDVDDVRGAEVYGVNNEKLGTVEDVIFNHGSGQIRYVVVDTGGWLGTKKFLVPANRISPYGNHDDKFYAELDKERIRMLPEYDQRMLKNEGDWSKYEKQYEQRWTDGAVMYNEQTGRIITPPPEQTTRSGNVASAGHPGEGVHGAAPQHMGRQDDLLGVAPSGDDVTLHPAKPSIGGRKDVELIREGRRQASRESDEELSAPLRGSRAPDMEGLREPAVYETDEVPEAEKRSDLNEPLNANYGPRWQRFQEKLRQRRDRVVSDCPLCGGQKKVA